MIHRVIIQVVVAAVCSFGVSLFAAEPGYFKVAEIEGVWWFIDPQGQPFYSLGVSDIGPGATREKFDQRRPEYAAFQHYNSTEAWADDTIKRLKSWNFNTLGSWAHPSLTDGALPYAEVLHIGARLGVPWNDLFSDTFASQMQDLARERVVPRSSDQNLVGWFTDNELGWYPDTLFHYHLSQLPTSATRAKLLEVLNQHYQHDFALLKRDFDVTEAASFDDLKLGGKLKLRANGRGRRVVLQFAGAVAVRYYKVAHAAIRRYDANHLILGDRYPWHCPKPVAEAARRYVDVVSTNFDWSEATDGYLPCGYLRNLHQWSGRPVLVTECYVAARENRSGNKNTGGIFLTVDTQKARVKAAQNRLKILASEPYVVGAHWFRFADEPPHGRKDDGEDYNFGLVDINNQPYDALVSAFTQLNLDLLSLHKESRSTLPTNSSVVCLPFVPQPADDLHNQLGHLHTLEPIVDSLGVHEIRAAWNYEKLYVVALVCHVTDAETYSAELPANDRKLKLTLTTPAMDSPVQIRFGGSNDVSTDNHQVKCWISVNGLRHTLVVALPSALLQRPAFQKNDELELGLSLGGLSDEESAEWRSKCLLVGSQDRNPVLNPKRDQVQERSVSPSPASVGE